MCNYKCKYRKRECGSLCGIMCLFFACKDFVLRSFDAGAMEGHKSSKTTTVNSNAVFFYLIFFQSEVPDSEKYTPSSKVKYSKLLYFYYEL